MYILYCDNMKKDLFLTKNLIAHRGVHYEYLENSLKAFREAMYKGYIIELDIHLTKDKKIIVFHDYNLKRLTGILKNIEELTYKEIIKIIKVPTIEEVLNLVKGRVPIIIETKIKDKVGPLESKLSNILDNYKGEFAIQSFNSKSIAWFNKYRKNYIKGYLINSIIEHNIITSIILNRKLKKLNIDYIGINLDYLKNKKIIKLRNKYLIIGYTINNELEYNKYIDYADNLICNIKKIPYYKELNNQNKETDPLRTVSQKE